MTAFLSRPAQALGRLFSATSGIFRPVMGGPAATAGSATPIPRVFIPSASLAVPGPAAAVVVAVAKSEAAAAPRTFLEECFAKVQSRKAAGKPPLFTGLLGKAVEATPPAVAPASPVAIAPAAAAPLVARLAAHLADQVPAAVAISSRADLLKKITASQDPEESRYLRAALKAFDRGESFEAFALRDSVQCQITTILATARDNAVKWRAVSALEALANGDDAGKIMQRFNLGASASADDKCPSCEEDLGGKEPNRCSNCGTGCCDSCSDETEEGMILCDNCMAESKESEARSLAQLHALACSSQDSRFRWRCCEAIESAETGADVRKLVCALTLESLEARLKTETSPQQTALLNRDVKAIKETGSIPRATASDIAALEVKIGQEADAHEKMILNFRLKAMQANAA